MGNVELRIKGLLCVNHVDKIMKPRRYTLHLFLRLIINLRRFKLNKANVAFNIC